jgi:hypothetical protein
MFPQRARDLGPVAGLVLPYVSSNELAATWQLLSKDLLKQARPELGRRGAKGIHVKRFDAGIVPLHAIVDAAKHVLAEPPGVSVDMYQCIARWEAIAYAAGAHGQLDVLQWLLDGPHSVYGAFSGAGAQGRLDVLKWLYSKLRHLIYFDPVEAFGGSCAEAAKAGHLHVLDWLLKQHFLDGRCTVDGLAQGGRKDVLRWVRQHDIVRHLGYEVCDMTRADWTNDAAAGGHTHVLKYLDQQNLLRVEGLGFAMAYAAH